MSYKAHTPGSNPDVITYMSYEEWENIKDAMNAKRLSSRIKERKRKSIYYHRQRKLGAIIFIIGLLCMIAGCTIDKILLQCFGGIIGFVGIYLVLTKQMVLVDSYYLERQDKINEYYGGH